MSVLGQIRRLLPCPDLATSWLFCLLQLVLLPNAAAAAHSVAYFNSSLGSQINISAVLNLRSLFIFSFRTCSPGRLIYQSGLNEDFYQIHLTQNGSLAINWRFQTNSSGSASVSDLVLTDNEWYTVESSFSLGNIYVKVEQRTSVKANILLANSTYRSYLWSLNLTEGSPLQVGGDFFSGCIQEGVQIRLSDASTSAFNVEWDHCPLDDSIGCGAPVQNPCWSYPCQNDGVCVSSEDGVGFRCQCARGFSGAMCEVDMSSHGCEMNPCLNNATCQSLNSTSSSRNYLCNCSAGFVGVNCEIDKNECLSNPCRSGGRCIDAINSFTCDCSGTGFTGTWCQTNINECLTGSVLCLNGGACIDTPGSYKCDCSLGYSGVQCQNQSDECISNPCLNSGTCQSFLGYYRCHCAPGFTGDNCEENINDCVGIVCSGNYTICVDGILTYTCQCLPGYHDLNSSSVNVTTCEDINECSSNPCVNGSTCINGENNYSCRCASGYTGKHCDTDINECLTNPCLNGGTCLNFIGSFKCQCLNGFTGSNCSTDINECLSKPCLNGATCNDLVNRFECNCSAGWAGNLCQLDIDECASQPCLNGGGCKNLISHYNCTCLDGFQGQRCEVNVDDCDESYCLNNGTCIDGINNYTCHCTDDWMGRNCSLVYDSCALNVCQNGATCSSVPRSHNYTCNCTSGFTGLSCEINIDDCLNSSCPLHQICFDGIDSYSCACPPGTTGANCEVDINECLSDPCLNDARCVDGRNNFSCVCNNEVVNLTAYSGNPKSVFRIGYNGSRCEQLINACAMYTAPSVCLNKGICQLDENSTDTFGFNCYCPNIRGQYYAGRFCQLVQTSCDLAKASSNPVCQNGGTCIPNGDDYFCSCMPGYTGVKCQQEIDECESDPCRYNGTCQDFVNRYACVCPSGTTGFNCETNIDECASKPCMNSGQCIDLLNAYQCNCSETGYSGINCAIDIDECLSQPCQHNSTCYNGVKMYNCTCFSGYDGINCEIDIDECSSSPCQNNGTCHERSNSSRSDFSYATAAGFYCDCPVGFTGSACEVNIDECLSRPCSFGLCEDRVNGYTCHCQAGYRGVNCQFEINECLEYTPCQNNATCLDKVADYDCLCASYDRNRQLELHEKVFGGKNCSVELTGCQNNSCQNGASCRPVLTNESLNIHDFTCLCTSGFVGRLCNTSTVVSLGLSSQLTYRYSSSSVLSLSFGFRTTLRNVMLLYIMSNVTRATLELNDQTLIFESQSSNVYDGQLVINYPGQKVLNDGNWHGIQLNISLSEISLLLVDPVCSNKINCTDSMHFNGSQFSDAVFQFGGNRSEISKKIFVGCMQDIQVNDDIFVPEERIQSQRFMSQDLLAGCPRFDQCNPNPCGNKGHCEDLWTSYLCLCERPFWGTNCTKRYSSATFGYNNLKSYAQFNLSYHLQNILQFSADVSFFFRTRSSGGLLFYAGSTVHQEIQSNKTSLMLELSEGELRSRVNSDDGEFQCHVASGNLADGQQHFVHFVRNYSSLRIVVDNAYAVCGINASDPFFISVFFVGGISVNDISSRMRRATDPRVTVPAPQIEDFHGTIEDLRIFDVRMQFFPTNESDSLDSDVIGSSVLSDVLPGEETSDICRIWQPCENNATCTNVFFDDFMCRCDDRFRGRNCSELNYCIYNLCPSGSICNSISDGYECVSNATFNGASSILQYSYTLNQLVVSEILANVRTRKQNGTILRIQHQSQPSVCSIAVKLFNGEVLLQINTVSANQSNILLQWSVNNITVADGSEHQFHVLFRSDDIQLSVDNDSIWTNGWSEISSKCNFSSNNLEVLVGGEKKTTLINSQDGTVLVQEPEFFKGCLAELRINGVLLPFFDASQMTNNTSRLRFDIKEGNNVLNGCIGDDVCGLKSQCANGATCEDIWNAFQCDCAPGFTGDLCTTNIDDCAGNTCHSNATCVDGITSYSCACSSGFTGSRCETDIDECLSNPCFNGGTCLNQVNQYFCSCAAGFHGLHCELSDQDDCDKHFCQNSGTCVAKAIGPNLVSKTCICPKQYTGQNCEQEIDFCANNTCLQNTSSCHAVSEALNYTCVCIQGYTGNRCAEDINECSFTDSCLNGGNCSNIPGSFLCSCPPDWTGPTCGEKFSASHGLTPNEIGIIVGVILGTALLAVIIAVIVFLVIARKKRATHGTYSPSWQEMIGSRVDMRSALKLPPEERLI